MAFAHYARSIWFLIIVISVFTMDEDVAGPCQKVNNFKTNLSGLVFMRFGMVRVAAPLLDPGADKIQHAPVDVGPAAL